MSTITKGLSLMTANPVGRFILQPCESSLACPVRTAEECAEEWNRQLRPGTLKTGHLPCPYCEHRFTSSATLRYHKLTQHNDLFNQTRAAKGLPPLKNPIPQEKRRRTENLQSLEKVLPEQSAAPSVPDVSKELSNTSSSTNRLVFTLFLSLATALQVNSRARSILIFSPSLNES